ncbi:MAG: hypothetical protein EBY22_14480 [Gammaproteobacteria bacterium]|nr:hypothetical protein [Gammaproteobacteria bacterium]
MNKIIYKKLIYDLSRERLEPYGRDGASDSLIMARYLWNIATCESLYSSIHLAEISLRNSIHKQLIEFTQKPDWYESTNLVSEWQWEEINYAKLQIIKKRKVVTPGGMIAELRFGFWTGFFNKFHAKSGIGHKLAASVFPYAPRIEKDMRKIDYRWTRIRELRNRVFHHERIIHWNDLDLQYMILLESINWISPDLCLINGKINRFNEIRQSGVGPWIKLLSEIGDG